MLVAGVVDDQLGDDAQTSPMCFTDEATEVPQRAVVAKSPTPSLVESLKAFTCSW